MNREGAPRASSRFEIVDVLGEGSGGVVYRAVDHDSGEMVAVKTLRAKTGDALALLNNEFRVVQDLHHPNLVQIRDLVNERDEWLLSMEYVDGVDLLRHVQARSPGAGRLFDETRLRAALRQLAAALAALHRAGRIHRDVKPSNVLVTREGRVVVLDFGIALDASTPMQRSDADMAGTVPYMAPEQILGEGIGPPADWYAVGVILFRAMTGRYPYEGSGAEIMDAKLSTSAPDPRAIAPGLPEDLAALCVDLLRSEADARPDGADVLRRLGDEHDSQPAPPESSPTCVGRDEELDVLRRAYADARAANAVTVVVEGESGVGKSLFARAFAHELLAGDAPPLVFLGRCYEREDVPFRAFSAVMSQLATYLRARADEGRGVVAEGAGLVARIFPELQRVPAIAERADAPSLDPTETRRRTFVALRELVANVAAESPLVLIIDDLQWADRDSFELLTALTRSPHAPPILIVGTMRTVAEPARKKIVAALAGEVRMLPLERLSAASAARLVDEVSAQLGAPIDPELARGLVDEAGGHPMFLVELLRQSARAGRRAEGLRFDDAVRARVARLPSAARRLLDVVCLTGVPIPLETVARAAAVAPDEAPAAVTLLRAEHLVVAAGGRRSDVLEAYHDRIREAVVASIAASSAREWHGRIALALEHMASPDPEMLSHHWVEAGDPVRGAGYAAQAAARANGSLAFGRAARFYEAALRLDPSDPERVRRLRLQLADALTNAGQWAEAADNRLAVAQECEGLEALSLRQQAAEQLLCSGHFDRGVAMLEGLLRVLGFFVPRGPITIILSVLFVRLLLRLRGLGHAERSEKDVAPRELARLDVLAAAGYGLAMTDNVLSSYFMTRGALFALKIGEPHRLARSLAMTAGIHSAGGRAALRGTQRLIDATRAVAERLGTPVSLGMTSQAEAWKHYCIGAWTPAKHGLLRAELIYREQCVGVTFLIGSVRSILYRTLAYRGDLVELAERLAPVLREADAVGDVHAATNIRTSPLVWLRLAADAPRVAREELEWVSARLPTSRFLLQHYFYVNAQAMVHFYEDDARGAHACVEGTWGALRRSLLMRIPVVRALAVEQRGRSALAMAHVDPAGRPAWLARALAAARRLEREQMDFADGYAALLRAGVARLRGAQPDAIANARRAHATFTRADMALAAAAARACEGAMVGGADGARAIDEAFESMAREEVLRPERFVTMFAPGLRAGVAA